MNILPPYNLPTEAEERTREIVARVRHEIEMLFKFGGPTPFDLECVIGWGSSLAQHDRGGTELFTGFPEYMTLPDRVLSKADIEQKRLKTNMLVRSIAVFAFLPGGIHIYGEHFEVSELTATILAPTNMEDGV